jgi:hypothetical protein
VWKVGGCEAPPLLSIVKILLVLVVVVVVVVVVGDITFGRALSTACGGCVNKCVTCVNQIGKLIG